MPTPLDTFASYLPAVVTRHHSAATSAPDQPSRRPLRAALLFADISGFTALTEQLAQRGPAGVEELSRLLNTSFGQIIDTIETHGGDVVKFAGDALLAIWPVEDAWGTGDWNLRSSRRRVRIWRRRRYGRRSVRWRSTRA